MKKIVPKKEVRGKYFSLSVLLLVSLIILSCQKQSNPEIINANGAPVIHWTADKDIILEEDYVLEGKTLIIDPGTNIYLKEGCSIISKFSSLGTSLIAHGTKENPINFLPFCDENGNEKYWGGIQTAWDVELSFSYCNFIKGGKDVRAIIYDTPYSFFCSLSIKNCHFDYSLSSGVSVNTLDEFSNNTIQHTEGQPITLSAKDIGNMSGDNIIIPTYPKQGIIVTQGNSQDTVIWRKQTVPYIISSNLSLSNGVNIIKPGTTLAFGEYQYFTLGSEGSFIALGDSTNPITFTSVEEHPEAGDWCKIVIRGKATFRNCIFEYGGDIFSKGEMIGISNSSDVSFENCIFRHSKETAISLYHYNNPPFVQFKKFSNNSFFDMGKYAISMPIQSTSSIGANNNFNGYGIYIEDTDIESNVVWKKINTDYYVDDYIYIDDPEGAKLVVEPGVHAFWSYGGLVVNRGVLVAEGTADDPIVFSSASENPYYGDWSGITFHEHNLPGSVISYLNILYAGKKSPYSGLYYAAMEFHACNESVIIENCTIAYSESCGIRTYGNDVLLLMQNNVFIDNLDGDICSYGK